LPAEPVKPVSTLAGCDAVVSIVVACRETARRAASAGRCRPTTGIAAGIDDVNAFSRKMRGYFQMPPDSD
jgi:hypothetical protein